MSKSNTVIACYCLLLLINDLPKKGSIRHCLTLYAAALLPNLKFCTEVTSIPCARSRPLSAWMWLPFAGCDCNDGHMTQTPKSRWYTLLHVTTYYCTYHNHWALYVLHITSILGRLHVVQAGDKGTISFGYCSCCSNGAHSYNHDLASADSGTSRGPWAGCLMYSVNSWSRDTRSAMKCPWCANSLLHYYYNIITSLLHHYYDVITFSIIALLLHYYYILLHWLLLPIITTSLLHYYYTLLHHY